MVCSGRETTGYREHEETNELLDKITNKQNKQNKQTKQNKQNKQTNKQNKQTNKQTKQTKQNTTFTKTQEGFVPSPSTHNNRSWISYCRFNRLVDCCEIARIRWPTLIFSVGLELLLLFLLLLPEENFNSIEAIALSEGRNEEENQINQRVADNNELAIPHDHKCPDTSSWVWMTRLFLLSFHRLLHFDLHLAVFSFDHSGC